MNNVFSLPLGCNKLDGLLTWEHPTYNCEKHGFSMFNQQIDIVWPYDLLIVIANAKRIGNSSHVHGIVGY